MAVGHTAPPAGMEEPLVSCVYTDDRGPVSIRCLWMGSATGAAAVKPVMAKPPQKSERIIMFDIADRIQRDRLAQLRV